MTAQQGTPDNNCIACGSSARTLLYDFGGIKIFRCESCGLGVADPLAAPADTDGEYSEQYYENYYSGRPAEAAGEDEFAPGLFSRIESRIRPPGLLLDMGCGTGEYMAAAVARGWRCMGVDISPAAAEIAGKRSNSKVFAGTLAGANFESGAFDAVYMIHSLEHQTDPRAILAETRRILKPGGLLVVSVPNLDGEKSRREGREWFGLQPGRHVFFYTEKSLAALASSAGFKVDEISAPDAIVTGARIDRALGGAAGAAARKAVKKILGKKTETLRRAVAKSSGGDSVVMVAIRQND